MRERVLASIEKSSFRSVPTYHLSEAASVRPGVLTMGDALNIRHPVNGAGMTVIFRDIAIIQELLKDIPDLNDVESVQRAQKTFTSRRKSYTFVTNVFARCFYDIAFPPNGKCTNLFMYIILCMYVCIYEDIYSHLQMLVCSSRYSYNQYVYVNIVST